MICVHGALPPPRVVGIAAAVAFLRLPCCSPIALLWANLAESAYVKLDLIRGQWDELLRVAGSLEQGTVTASLLVARLHAQQRRSTLAGALQDYGRLVKTEFVLRYLHPPSAASPDPPPAQQG